MISITSKRTISYASRFIRYTYISQQKINEIQATPASTLVQKFKVLLKLSGFICSEAYKDFKKDMKTYSQLRNANLQTRTQQQSIELMRIKGNFLKALPPVAIFMVPFGAPLLLIYLSLFPKFLPTWLLSEAIYQQHLKEEIKNKIQGLQFFLKLQKNQKLSTTILREWQRVRNLKILTNYDLQILRQISKLLIGSYTDGTIYLNNLSFLKHFGYHLDYLFYMSVSYKILQKQIINSVDKNLIDQFAFHRLGMFEERFEYRLNRSIRQAEELKSKFVK